MTERRTETQPTTVPEEARRAGEIWGRWSWVELSVWTERMLTALENGVKGGKWYSLMDKVYSLGNLQSAFSMVKANKGSPGIDHQTIDDFASRLEENLERMAQALRDGGYRPQAIKRVWIPKPGSTEKRPLGIPCMLVSM
jgi:RNA-directed DNA polymerase